jgi:hypothetical protein
MGTRTLRCGAALGLLAVSLLLSLTAQTDLAWAAAPRQEPSPAPLEATAVIPAPDTPAAPTEAAAAVGLTWSLPQRIPGYDDNAAAPFLLADGTGLVHAFNSVQIGGATVIVYSQWTRTGGWTTPIDIVLSPWANQARLIGAYLDSAGWVHLAFFGGNDLGAAIFYTRAPLLQAGRADAWAPVRIAGEYAAAPTNGVLLGRDAELIIIYSGSRDGAGLYAVRSDDHGATWTDPTVVSLVGDEIHFPTAARAIYDVDGSVHLVWTLVNVSGNGDLLLYSTFNRQRGEWTNPVVLAERNPGDYEVDWGSIAAIDGQLLVLYDDSTPATRWLRRSGDGGRTWTDPVIPFNYVGEYGHAAFGQDSRGVLHMLLGNRTPRQTHGMWHTVWLGDRFADLTPVVAGPRVTSGGLAGRFDPSAPKLVIVRGNLILATWVTDPGAGRNGVWYAYTVLDAPELPLQAVATAIPTPTVTPTPELQIVASVQPTLSAALRAAPPPPQGLRASPGWGLGLALLPVLLFLGVVLLRQRLRRAA